MSKCGKNIEVAHEPQASVSLVFLTYFEVFCDLLPNRPTATWNLFVLYDDQKRKKTDTHTCLVSLDCLKIFSSLGKSQFKHYFSSRLPFFLCLTCRRFLWHVLKHLFLLKVEYVIPYLYFTLRDTRIFMSVLLLNHCHLFCSVAVLVWRTGVFAMVPRLFGLIVLYKFLAQGAVLDFSEAGEVKWVRASFGESFQYRLWPYNPECNISCMDQANCLTAVS